MKRNRLFILGIVTVLVALLSLTLVSGTFAKYTSQATGSDSARVAKWSIKVGTTEIANATPQTIIFDLFNTVKDTAGADEADVKVGSGETIVAPGTSGNFELVLTNESEVTAQLALAVDPAETDNNIPLQFSVDGTNWKDSLALALADVAVADLKLGFTGNSSALPTSKTVNVQWRWVFEGTTEGAHTGQTDVTDTDLGIAAQGTAPTYSVTLKVTATQVD